MKQVKDFDKNAARRRIVELRKTHGMNQNEISELIGMGGKAGFSAAEAINGRVFFTIDQLFKLKQVFDITWDYLLEGVKTPTTLKPITKDSTIKNEQLNSDSSSNNFIITLLKAKDDTIKAQEETIKVQQSLIESLKDKK